MFSLEKGQILISRFALIELIGAGGMGQVWQAWDQELQLEIAVKILDPDLAARPDRIELLKNECRNTRRLVHPHIVRVFDFHRSGNMAFISMEYIEGENLETFRRRVRKLTCANVVELVLPVTGALAYAHQLGVVHRDVKAANVLVDAHQAPRLTDFGIAGVFKSDIQALAMTSGGSLYSMSPQQLEGQPSRPSDDIYALGVLIYQLLSGYPPFYPEIDPKRILAEIPATVNQQLDRLDADIRIPDRLDDLIVQMLQKDPAARPGSMREVSQILEQFREDMAFRTSPPAEQVRLGAAEPSSQAGVDVITPLPAMQIEDRAGQRGRKQSDRMRLLALAAALVLLMAGGGVLWHFLSQNPFTIQAPANRTPTEEIRTRPHPAAPTAGKQPVEVDAARLAADKETAEQRLADFVEKKGALERQGGAEWGDPGYLEMTRLGQEADSLFIEKEYLAASEKYARAAVLAGELAGRADAALNRLLEEGQTALRRGDGSVARQKFATALMIDSSSRPAQQGLQRAKTIETVMQLMASGTRHEQNNDLLLAQKEYQEALRLDPYAEAAGSALNRVQDRINDAQFQKLMSEGLAALHNNNPSLARTKLLSARSIKPQSREVLDALAQVDQTIRLDQIDRLRQRAEIAERSEDWPEALASYQAVLKIDATVQFASRGKERALERIRIIDRLQFFLAQPDVLESDRQLENALGLLTEARAIAPQSPRLSAQVEELASLVKLAQTPVTIIIESDNLTQVAVYKVGQLGSFSVRELKLRPGTYTVVGARDGYQDVRQKIVIKPGQDSVRVNVTCRVKI